MVSEHMDDHYRSFLDDLFPWALALSKKIRTICTVIFLLHYSKINNKKSITIYSIFLYIIMDFLFKSRLGASTSSDKNLEGFCSVYIYYSILLLMSTTFTIKFLKICYVWGYCSASVYIVLH